MEGLSDLVPFVQLGAAGVLLAAIVWFGRYFIRLVSSGEWVPRRELDYTRDDRDARLAECAAQIADWKAAHETSERARELLSGSLREAVEALRAQDRFFASLRTILERASEGDREGSDGHP